MSNFSKWISYATILIASGCTAGGTLASKIPPRTPHRPVSITLPKPTAQATKPKVSTRPSRPSPPPSPQATPEASAKPERFEAEISDSQISDSQIFDSPAPPHDLVLDLPDSAEEEEHAPGERATPATGGQRPTPFLYDVPIVRNSAVDRWIEYFTGPGRKNFSEWLRRGGRYMNRFREILREKGLPQDLAYLALIESGFSLRARSRAGAVGPWQFMRATARRKGLKVNRYIDERRDPDKATRAAALFLGELHEEFQDWHLALAAYNSGENRVRRAIRRTGRKTYWALVRTRHLPKETKNYVPKFLAGMIIAKNPEVFGFSGIEYARPLRYDTVALPRGMSLRAISRLSGVSLKELTELNSELRWYVTPPIKGHLLRLPTGKAGQFLELLANSPKAFLPESGRYRILPGDTFGAIALRFGIRLKKLLELNAHLNPRRLRVGTRILLPKRKKPRKVSFAKMKTRPKKQAARNGSRKRRSDRHVVGPGENVWVIARRYGVSPNQILRLNGLSPSTTIFPGKRLRIHQ
ncbi:MAG: transglycosylase SLT domain-containing protein [Nitrospinota bacterium]|nr:transglycosylase SLT domain-containing protein [Nitrospinota bacterium]MDP7168341.1 transglycosylase SLT domain-containing protein [Nitrospinota bacterium]MDP7369792.1 transglycosylase SLT domain-containing protein [Nitrospinota bacterium]MDP7503843.1 transglycosylase SLT domain-containing protein [Nitrospinota bacterium]MDP7662437.1 transglycosylase SLT domain-containing protein [Nitrospinota bacterium]